MERLSKDRAPPLRALPARFHWCSCRTREDRDKSLTLPSTDKYTQYLHFKPINPTKTANMLALALKADMEGYRPSPPKWPNNLTNIFSVTDLQPQDTEEEPFHYTFKVQCTSCREVHPNWVTVNRHVRKRIASRGHGPAH
jgi:hypothetical protein